MYIMLQITIMTTLTSYQRAAITKRRNTRDAFMGAADTIFERCLYRDIQVKDITRQSGRSEATFYNAFLSKNDWAIDVLNARLNKALTLYLPREEGGATVVYTRALGRLSVFEGVSTGLPGITQGLIEERTRTGGSHSKLLPEFHRAIVQVVHEGQEERLFRADIEATQMADFAIDSLSLACAIKGNNAPSQIMNPSTLIVDGFTVRQ